MPDRRRFRRGIYLLPTCFTTGNLFCGFFAIIEAGRGRFGMAALLIVIAGILDGLDGRIARLTGTTSEFGVQFDSLADIVSFGVSPALVAYYWALTPLGRRGWMVAFLFVACAAVRLARFNIQHGAADRRFFAGLPSPAAAGSIATLVYAFPEVPPERSYALGVAALVVIPALLMVSTVRYRSFKDLDLKIRRSHILVPVIAAAIVLLFTERRYALLVLAWLYLVWGPVGHLIGIVFRGRAKDPTTVAPDTPPEAADGRASR